MKNPYTVSQIIAVIILIVIIVTVIRKGKKFSKSTGLVLDRQSQLDTINKIAKSKKEEDILGLVGKIGGSDEEINNAYINAVRVLDNNKIISEIKNMLTNKKHFDYPLRGIIAARDLGLKELVPEIAKQLEHKVFLVKEFAISTLDRFDAKETTPELTKLISDKAVGSQVRKLLDKWGVKYTIPDSK